MPLPRTPLAPFFPRSLAGSSVRTLGRHDRTVATLGTESLDKWTETVLQTPHHSTDVITLTTALKLFHTLPTRSGPIYSTPPPVEGAPFQPGHHLVLFPPLFPESVLNQDGTEPTFSPTLPWTRRMWAGGEIKWATDNDLKIGDSVKCESVVDAVERKGWDGDRPKVFVWQKHTVSNENGVALVERRAHVFQPPTEDGAVSFPHDRPNPDLPEADFSITFTPTPLTLFRFSALTFNAHRIHYDPIFTASEGHGERLVHAPLTSLLLLETANFQLPPSGRLSEFSYRATRPLLVDRAITFAGAWKPNARGELVLWALDDEGRVAMTGEAKVVGLH